jgi:hypothetical protein
VGLNASLDALVGQAVREGRLSAAAGEAWYSTRGVTMSRLSDAVGQAQDAMSATHDALQKQIENADDGEGMSVSEAIELRDQLAAAMAALDAGWEN